MKRGTWQAGDEAALLVIDVITNVRMSFYIWNRTSALCLSPASEQSAHPLLSFGDFLCGADFLTPYNTFKKIHLSVLWCDARQLLIFYAYKILTRMIQGSVFWFTAPVLKIWLSLGTNTWSRLENDSLWSKRVQFPTSAHMNSRS